MPSILSAHCTAKQFAAWRQRMGWPLKKAAKELGLAPQTIKMYERGKRYEDGNPAPVPQRVWAHCCLIEQFMAQSAALAKLKMTYQPEEK